MNEGETASIETLILQINGTDLETTEFELINNGNLTITYTAITCSHAKFTLTNKGTLNFGSPNAAGTGAAAFTLNHNSTLTINNLVTCQIASINIQVYAGYAYLANSGSLTVHNGYFKDQHNGTSITNYGEADFSSCTFVANGAYGRIDLLNKGNLQLNQGVFDANYGGKINIKSQDGTLNLTAVSFDVSGASHGQRSQTNIALDGSAKWSSKTSFFVYFGVTSWVLVLSFFGSYLPEGLILQFDITLSPFI